MSAINEISARDKRALLAELLRRRASKPVTAPTSFAQQRLWFLDQLEPGTPLYNVNTAVRMQGPLDVKALERSFEFMVQRHETLRTTFELQDGRPVQVINPHVPQGTSLECGGLTPLWSSAERGSHVDQSGVKPPHSREVPQSIKHMLEEEALKPFDLASGPLLRMKLLRLGDDDHVAARAADPVRRLRALATRVAHRRCAGDAAHVLAEAARRRRDLAATDRSPTAR